MDNDIRNDQKLLKKIFGEKPAYYHFMLDNVQWILEKTLYDFTKDECHGFVLYIQKNAAKIVQSSKELPAKFDILLKKFLIDQGQRP